MSLSFNPPVPRQSPPHSSPRSRHDHDMEHHHDRDDNDTSDEEDDRKPAAKMTTVEDNSEDSSGSEDENDDREDKDDHVDQERTNDDDDDDDGDDGDSNNENDTTNDQDINDNDSDTNQPTNNQKTDDGLSEYERLREERIRRNQEYLARLGLDGAATQTQQQQQQQRRKLQQQQQRLNNKTVVLPKRHSLGRASKQRTTTYSDSMSLKELLASSRAKLPPATTKARSQQDQDHSSSLSQSGLVVLGKDATAITTAATITTAPTTSTATAESPPLTSSTSQRKKSQLDQRVPWPVHREFKRIGKLRRDLQKRAQRSVKVSIKWVLHFQKQGIKYQKYLQRKQNNQNHATTTTKRQLQLQHERDQLNGKTQLECLQELEKNKTKLWQVVVDFERDEKKAAKLAQVKQQKDQLAQKQAQFQIKMDYVDTWDVLPKSYPIISQQLALETFRHAPPDPPPPRRSTRGAEDHAAFLQHESHGTLPPSLSSSLSSSPVQSEWQRLVRLAYANKLLSDTTRSGDEPAMIQSLVGPTTQSRSQGQGVWISPFLAHQLDREWISMNHDNSTRSIGTTTTISSRSPLVPQVGNLILYYPGAHKAFLQKYPDVVGQASGSVLRVPLWERHTIQSTAATPADSDTAAVGETDAAAPPTTSSPASPSPVAQRDGSARASPPPPLVPPTRMNADSGSPLPAEVAAQDDDDDENDEEEGDDDTSTKSTPPAGQVIRRGRSVTRASRITNEDSAIDVSAHRGRSLVGSDRQSSRRRPDRATSSIGRLRSTPTTWHTRRGQSSNSTRMDSFTRFDTDTDGNITTNNRRIAPRSSRFQGTFKVPTESVRDLFQGAAVSAKIGTKKEEIRKLAEVKKRAKSVTPLSNPLEIGRSKVSMRKLKKIVITVGKTLTMELHIPTEPKKPRAKSRPRSEVDDTIDPFPDEGSDDHDELPLFSVVPDEETVDVDPDETPDGDPPRWWTDEWLTGIDSDLGRYPILCRVDQANAEFPQDYHKKKIDKHGNVTWITPSSSTDRTTKQHIRLCLKLQPLTPVIPPKWDEESGTIQEYTKIPLPPKFSVVTFPNDEVSPFIAPFSGAFAASHSLGIGDAIEGGNHGKIAEFVSMDGSYGSFRMDDKVNIVRSILQRLKHGNPLSVFKCLGLDTAQSFPEQDAAFLVEFLSIYLEEKASDENVTNFLPASTDDAISLHDLVRSCLPLFDGVGLRREAFHRKVVYACAWDLEPKKNRRFGLTERVAELMGLRLSQGIPPSLSNALQSKIRYSIQNFLDSRPEATGFANMVSEDDAPSYYCAVPIAMYFDLILARLDNGKMSGRCYYTSPESVLSDIQTIMINCRLYNSHESPLVTVCSSLIPVLKKVVAMVVIKHYQDNAKKIVESDIPSRLDSDTCSSIVRCFDVLKRRCLIGKDPDSCDDRYRLNVIVRGPTPVGQSTTVLRSLPTFEELLFANENAPVDENAMTTRGVRRVEEDDAVVRLAECLYLPPYLIKKTLDGGKLCEDSHFGAVLPSSTQCLELIRVRLKTGYYQQRASIIDDLQEAYISSVLYVLSGPESRTKKRISAIKITNHLCLLSPISLLNGDRAPNTVTETIASFSETERALLTRLERAQKLYSMAILAVKETEHVERLFGFVCKPSVVSSGAREGHGGMIEHLVGNPQRKAAARRIRYLLAATGREPCLNKFTNFGALKVTVAVGDDKIRLKHKATNNILSSVSFGFDDFLANDDLANALLKRPGKRAPCARCQILGQAFYACRVVRSHSNPDYDFVANWKECGGVDGLLAAFNQSDSATIDATEMPRTNTPIDVTAMPRTNEPLDQDKTDTPSDGQQNDQVNGENDGAPKDDDVVVMDDPSDDLAKAQEMVQMAKRLERQAEELSKKPPRLGKRFIETNFPIDPSDGRYTWCTICGLSGDVLCCDGCVNVVHPACVSLEEVPDGDWFCEECTPKLNDGQEAASEPTESREQATSPEPVAGTVVPSTLTEYDLENHIDALDRFLEEWNQKRYPNGEPARKTKIRVGTEFYKTFPGIGRFKGTVYSLPVDGRPFLHVKYDDGDAEDLEEEEILQLIEESQGANASQTKKRGRPRNLELQAQDDGAESTKKRVRIETDSERSPGQPMTGPSGRIAESDNIPVSNRRTSLGSRMAARSLGVRAMQATIAVTVTHKGWSDEENDLFFDGINTFKPGRKRDDRWLRIADNITTKTRKQVFDQMYWFFAGSRERAHQAYLGRKGLTRKTVGASKQKIAESYGRGASKAKESSSSRHSRSSRPDDEETNDEDLPHSPRRGRPPKKGTDDDHRDNDENPKPSKGKTAAMNKGRWTDYENDLFFDGIEKFSATSTRNAAWDNIAESIETRPNKQVMDQLYAYFKGFRDNAFREFCDRRGFLSMVPHTKQEDSSTDSDDGTPPPSEQKRRGPVSVFRINPLPREPSRSMASAESSLSDEDWDAPSQRKRGRGRPRGSTSRIQEVRADTPSLSHAMPSGRMPRRCIRCRQFNGKYAMDCRGRIGRYGQAGCEFFSSSGKPLKTRPDTPDAPAGAKTDQGSGRKRARSESPVRLPDQTSQQRGDRANRRRSIAILSGKLQDRDDRY